MTSKVDGEINLRHRALGALVLVLLGIVVLPIILNGASMAPEVVQIESVDGNKAPRTFETNIRPVDNDTSLVTVESESADRLKAEVRFDQNDGQGTDTVENSTARQAPNEQASSSTQPGSDDESLPIAESAPAADDDSRDVNQVDSNKNMPSTVGDSSAEESSVIEPLPPIPNSTIAEQTNPTATNAGDDSNDSAKVPSIAQEDEKLVVARTTDIGAKADDELAITTDKTVAVDKSEKEPTVVANAVPSAVDQKDEKKPAENATLENGWVVRVGTFGRADNASRLVDILKEKGFSGRTSLSKTKSGKTLTRVWVGPFTDRQIATRELTRIERSTGEKGFVTAYP